jgi:hypothetical protein
MRSEELKEQPPVVPLSDSWQNILWQEWRCCKDRDYAQRLRQAIAGLPFGWFHRLIPNRKPRPYAHEVEAALREACNVPWGGRHAWRKYLRRLDQTKDKAIPIETLIADLHNFHWFKRFLARQGLLHRGGEAVEALATLPQGSAASLQEIASWLLRSISAETTSRIGQEPGLWVCLQCLARCEAHSIPLDWQPDLVFYGCRICRRSAEVLYCPQGIVAMLDHGQTRKYEQKDGLLRVNWIVYRAMFDFDRVEISQASDEEVERFVVQMGNHVDPSRKPTREMSCLIDSGCRLSENSMRVLESVFGSIVISNW